jgi:hypothetical protein
MMGPEPVCSCALCAYELGEPNEAQIRELEREATEMPDPPEMWLWGRHVDMMFDRLQ